MSATDVEGYPINPLLDDLAPRSGQVTRAQALLAARQVALDNAVRYAIAQGQQRIADISTGGNPGPVTSVRDTAAVFERWLLRAPDGEGSE